MTTPTLANLRVARAHATGSADQVVESLASELRTGVGSHGIAAILYFASSRYHPDDLVGPLCHQFPGVPMIGCSTAGEFTEQITGTEGVTAIAIPHGILRRAAAALGDLTDDVVGGTEAAVATLQAGFGARLRSLDPTTHLGFALIDGMHGAEEMVNLILGNAAPALNFVGGSAGDDLAFKGTWVAVGNQVSWNGVALMVAEAEVPFQVVKSCSFTSTGRTLRITKADVPNRTVLEFDGRPAVEVYAESLGLEPGQVDSSAFMSHPVGLMMDGDPWIRSPQQVGSDGTGLRFYAQIIEGMDVDVMTSGDLVKETGLAIDKACADLGNTISGAVMFNCILRRLEIDSLGIAEPFLDSFRGIPVAGFHTYGETWLGHINQTLTGVVFGSHD